MLKHAKNNVLASMYFSSFPGYRILTIFELCKRLCKILSHHCFLFEFFQPQGKHWLAAVEILLESPSSLVLRVPKFPIKQQKGASNLCLGYAFFSKYSREILTPADSSSRQLHGSNDWLRCSQETAGDYLLV